jgi:hypothetical protein
MEDRDFTLGKLFGPLVLGGLCIFSWTSFISDAIWFFSEIREHRTFVALSDWSYYSIEASLMLFPVFVWSGGADWLTRRAEQLKGTSGLLLVIVALLVPYLVPVGVGNIISVWLHSTVDDNGYAYCIQRPQYSTSPIRFETHYYTKSVADCRSLAERSPHSGL